MFDRALQRGHGRGHTRTYLLLGMAEGVGTRAHVCCWAWSWAWALAPEHAVKCGGGPWMLARALQRGHGRGHTRTYLLLGMAEGVGTLS